MMNEIPKIMLYIDPDQLSLSLLASYFEVLWMVNINIWMLLYLSTIRITEIFKYAKIFECTMNSYQLVFHYAVISV